MEVADMQQLHEVDKIEILTLQDNYIDIASGDNTEIITRAMPLKGMEIKNSIIAEHGFSALVKITQGQSTRSLLFDFGFSQHGAAFNAEALSVDLTEVEVMALSHGHMDHFGGLKQLTEKIGKPGIKLVLHPAAFRKPRYIKITEEFKIIMPSLTRDVIEDADIQIIESIEPYPLLDESILFLGQIPRKTDFEKGMPNFYYEQDGTEIWDSLDDDTAIVANIKNKGLVVLSGCAHSGIINTVTYAKELTGINQVYAVMGGFHLTGADFEPIIPPTTQALKDIDPTYIIPTHCTGRKAIMTIEKEMPDKFLLNMSGSTLTFS